MNVRKNIIKCYLLEKDAYAKKKVLGFGVF